MKKILLLFLLVILLNSNNFAGGWKPTTTRLISEGQNALSNPLSVADIDSWLIKLRTKKVRGSTESKKTKEKAITQLIGTFEEKKYRHLITVETDGFGNNMLKFTSRKTQKTSDFIGKKVSKKTKFYIKGTNLNIKRKENVGYIIFDKTGDSIGPIKNTKGLVRITREKNLKFSDFDLKWDKDYIYKIKNGEPEIYFFWK